MYHSRDQARMRLTGCIVKLKGEWMYVQGVEEAGDDDEQIILVSSPVGSNDINDITRTVITDDCGLDARPMKLGYVWTANGWSYLYRVPHRRWKQGLHPDNMRCANTRTPSSLFNSKPLLSCLNNQYMSVEAAIKEGGAFNRYFAIKENKLWYRGTMVGLISKEKQGENHQNELLGGMFVLNEQYQYLKQQLEGAMA